VPGAYEQAQTYCKRIFERLQCPGIDIAFYIEACIADASIAGDVRAIADHYVTSYMSECGYTAHCLSRSTRKEDQTEALRIGTRYGFYKEQTWFGVKNEPDFAVESSSQFAKTVDEVKQDLGDNWQVTLTSQDGSPGGMLTCKNGGTLLTSGGCRCTEEFSGFDCSVDLRNAKQLGSAVVNSNAVALTNSMVVLCLTVVVLVFTL
jgi:hypothetical protein